MAVYIENDSKIGFILVFLIGRDNMSFQQGFLLLFDTYNARCVGSARDGMLRDGQQFVKF